MAFQIPEELFQRIKTHLARETARTGVKLTPVSYTHLDVYKRQGLIREFWRIVLCAELR